MSETIEAVFNQGVFTPCEPVSIPNGQRVTLTFTPTTNEKSPPAWPDLPSELVNRSDGVIVARGSRITLFLMLEFHFDGTPWTQMQEDFPTVQPGDWYGIESYVKSNEAVLKVYSEQRTNYIESIRTPTPPGLTLEGLRERFQKKYGFPYPAF